MSSPLEYQGKPQRPDPVALAKDESVQPTATTRFESYKLLVRKLAHHLSGTGDAMTQKERSELREIMQWGAAPQRATPRAVTPPSAANKLIFRSSRAGPKAK